MIINGVPDNDDDGDGDDDDDDDDNQWRAWHISLVGTDNDGRPTLPILDSGRPSDDLQRRRWFLKMVHRETCHQLQMYF